jgi:hypothetical protein
MTAIECTGSHAGQRAMYAILFIQEKQVLRTHRIMISQEVDGADHWTIIQLQDKTEARDGTLVTGSWQHTSESYMENGKEVKFTSDNAEYLYWEWRGNASGGNFAIGSKMKRASHKAGEDEMFQVLISLLFCKRLAGKLTYRVSPHFEKGDITYNIRAY